MDIEQEPEDGVEEQPEEVAGGYWICQGANTAEVIGPDEVIPWRVFSYMRQIRRGDVVYFWQMGEAAAILGWGRAESEEPYQDSESRWRFDMRCETVFSAPVPRELLKQDPDLEAGLALFINPRGSLSPVERELAAVINQVIKRSKQEAPPPPALPADMRDMSSPATGGRLDLAGFRQRLDSKDKKVMQLLDPLLEEVGKREELYWSFGKATLILNWRHPGGQRVNVGMVRTDGTLDTRYVAYFTELVADDPEIGYRYLEKLADAVGGEVHREGLPWTWRVVKGERRPEAAGLLASATTWLELIDGLIAEVGERRERRIEKYPTHPDAPETAKDGLLRRPFAEAIGWRLRYVHRDQWPRRPRTLWTLWRRGELPPAASNRRHGDAFLVHLYAPWGAGKTTTLNFLEEHLEQRLADESHLGAASEPWLVVRFNAWQHQRTGPAWWPFLKAVSRQLRTGLRRVGERRLRNWLRASWLWTEETWWRSLRGRLSLLVSLILLGALVWLFRGWLAFLAEALFGEGPAEKRMEPFDVVKTLAALVTVAGSGWGLVRGLGNSLLTGSAKAAHEFERELDDPEGRLQRRFQWLIRNAGYPVAIFVDDLDRCESRYAVNFLEGVQTLFREAPVAYVVAADRPWLGKCFDDTYTKFAAAVGKPGRPLGYLFLEKTFQISVPLPSLSPGQRREMFLHLMGRPLVDREPGEGDEPAEHAAADGAPDQSVEEIRGRVRHLATPEAAADLEAELDPLLDRLPGILERNPRAIKRTVNALGMLRTIDLLQGERTDDETVARWAVAHMRWPALVNRLEKDPTLADHLGQQEGAPPPEVEDELRPLFSDPQVRRLFSDLVFELPLGSEQVKALVGS